MDRELWTSILPVIQRAAKRVGWHGGRRQPVYANWLIVAMYVWSVAHDRTLSWACDRRNYGALFRPRRLPSISQFTRRIKSADCQQILQIVHDQFAQRDATTNAVYIDGKPLTVSPVSKDRDAKRGRISGAFARGYKLYAAVNANRRIVVWSVMGLNEDEKTIARHALLPNLPPLTPDAVVLADSHYDSARQGFALRGRCTPTAPSRGGCGCSIRCATSIAPSACFASRSCGRCRGRGASWCGSGRSMRN